MHITQTIKTPILTEKSYKNIAENVYTFKVDVNANKVQIRKAFEIIFEVKVEKVNISNYRAKDKKLGKFLGKKSKYKKAMIKLKSGEKLDLFDNNVKQK